MDTLGLQPVLDYLKVFSLPIQPTILKLTQTDYNNYNFDWVTTVAKIKKTLGSDLLIGFDIFADLKNNTVKRLAFGSPDSGSMLPLYVIKGTLLKVCIYLHFVLAIRTTRKSYIE